MAGTEDSLQNQLPKIKKQNDKLQLKIRTQGVPDGADLHLMDPLY